MLADKMRAVLDTEAEIVTAGDASCLMHIGGGLSRLDAGVRTVHLAQILAAYMSTYLGIPTARRDVGNLEGTQRFPDAARAALKDTQLRRNLGHATATIRAKRLAVVGEVDDWEQLRDGRVGDQDRRDGPPPRAARAARSQRDRRTAAPCTGPATRPRPTPS